MVFYFFEKSSCKIQVLNPHSLEKKEGISEADCFHQPHIMMKQR